MTFSAKFAIIYGWFIRFFTFFFPEIPFFQAVRGYLYSFAMKKCGSNFKVSYNVVLNRLELLEVGDNVYFACGCVVVGGGKIKIGSNVLFGPNVVLAAANHKFDGKTFLNGYEFGEIVIEDNSWIGANVSLLMGTHIPASSVVGAGTVCNKKFNEPYSLIAGVPARCIKDIRRDIQR
jgi:acetyltransferase-like isoleucine patch superfamily enzyme